MGDTFLILVDDWHHWLSIVTIFGQYWLIIGLLVQYSQQLTNSGSYWLIGSILIIF